MRRYACCPKTNSTETKEETVLFLHEVHIDRIRRLRVVRDVGERALGTAVRALIRYFRVLVVELEHLQALLALEEHVHRSWFVVLYTISARRH